MAQKVEILNLDINTNALITKLSETKAEIERLKAAQKALTKEGDSSSQQFVEQAAQLSNLQRSYNQQKNVVGQLTTANKGSETAIKALTDALGKENVSVAEAAENNRKLTILRNQLNLATNEGKEALTLINKKLNENTEFIRENVSAQEQQRMEIGNYSNQIKDALSNLNPLNGGISGFIERSKEAGGTTNLLKQSFAGLTAGLGQALKASLAFIATPIGAVITGVVAAFAGAKAIFDFNQGLVDSNKELKALGVNASEISKVRSEIQATAETFDKDFKDIASKANSLSKSYGISMSEANDIIAKGLASGGAQNSEFLDSLGEYDGLFAKAGYSATEFVNIINAGYDLGIYADKLPDALKEADLALKEQTKSSRDALVNAFGASFSDDILKKVRIGELTTKDALDAIAKKSKETQLTQQQQAQLTADIFKGAGEDAGGALVILEAVSKSANAELSKSAKAQLELQQASERLNKAQADLFEVKDFGDVWTSIKTVATDALSSMLEYFSDVKKDIQPLIDLVGVVLGNAFQSLKVTFGVVFGFISGSFKVLSNTISTFFNFFKAIINGDFQGALNALKNGFNNLLNIVGNTFGKIKNTILEGLKSVVDNISPLLKAVGIDVEKLQKKLDGLKSKEVKIDSKTQNTETSTKQNEVVKDVQTADELKRIEDENKKIIDARQKRIDALIQMNKEEIDLYVASQGIKKKSLQDELAFEESLLNKRLALLKLEFDSKKISENSYLTQSLNLKNDFAKKQVDAMVANAAKELEDYKLLNQQKKDEDKFFSEEKLIQRQNENLALQLEEIKFQQVRLQQGVINQQQYNDAIDAINLNTKLKNEEAEKLRAEAEKEKQAIDLENKIATEQLNFENDFARRAEEIERNRLAEVAAAEKTGADVGLINSKFAAQKKALDKSIADFKLNQELQIVQGLKGLFGEQTALGKAAAVAEIGITTYSKAAAAFAQAALFAANPLTLPLAANAKVQGGVIIATGALQAAKVAGVKFADGGQVPTLGSGLINNGANLSIPLSNGDDTLAYVGQGEVILNKQQQAAAGGSQFFKSIGVPGFNAGGFVGGNTNLGTKRGQKIDLELMANLIAQANRNLPSPVVSVSEIAEVGNRVAVYESSANF